MKKTIICKFFFVIAVLALINILNTENEYYNLKLEELKQEYAIKPVSSVDHSKFSQLQREFSTPRKLLKNASCVILNATKSNALCPLELGAGFLC